MKRKGSLGFTFIEVVVAASIAAAMALFTIRALRSGDSAINLESVKSKLLAQHRGTAIRLRSDLDSAPVITGGSGYYYPGIARVSLNPTNDGALAAPRNNDPDAIGIYVMKYEQFRSTMAAIANGAIYIKEDSTNDLQWNITRYVEQSFLPGNYIFTQNQDATNIFPIASPVPNRTDGAVIDVTNLNTVGSAYFNPTSTVTPVDRVEYWLDGDTLYRHIRHGLPNTGSVTTPETIATNVTSFAINYVFTNHPGRQIVAPGVPLSHPIDPSYVHSGDIYPNQRYRDNSGAWYSGAGACTAGSGINCCSITSATCAEWFDVDEVILTIQYTSQFMAPPNFTPSTDFSVVGGFVAYNANEVFRIPHYYGSFKATQRIAN